MSSVKVYLLSAIQAFLAFGPSSYYESYPNPQLPLTSFAAPVVDLGYSQYQGSANTTTNITSFLALRYAAPPLGNLRWAAPQPPPTTSGIQDATTQPGGCYTTSTGINMDNPSFSLMDNESEDCLFLNVFVPGTTVAPAPSGRGLPVVVWIHGGGYIAGAAKYNDGSDLVRDSNNGVIAVVIQYRLGVFGFLAGEAVKRGGSLNAGLLDQNYALKWVQAHISSFGGDTSRVTIWGESAGGGSVLQHLVAHRGNTHSPLFKAAITSSPFLPSQYHYNDEKPESLYGKVVNGTNCNSKSDTLACLRAADAQAIQLMNVEINLSGFYGTFTFVPVVDGEFIVERPTETMRRGKMNGKRLMAVHNTNEGNFFVNQTMQLTFPQYLQRLFPYFGIEQIAGADVMYRSLGPSVQQANAAMGEAMFICPAYYLLQAFRNRNWKGHFAVPPALHGGDMPYYFTSLGPSYKNPQFIQSFSNSFLAMVMYGTPDHRYNAGDITPTWNTWGSDFNEIVFSDSLLGRPNVYASKTDHDMYNRCAFWRSVTGYTLQ